MGPHKRLVLLILLLVASFSSLPAQVRAEITVKSHYHLIDDMYHWYHVYGEVKRSATATSNYSVRVGVSFSYTDGSPSDHVSADTLLDLVESQPRYDTAPFHIILANATKAAKVSSYNFELELWPRANFPYRRFTNSSAFYGVDHKCRVNGTVINSGTTNATFVQVIATFYSNTTAVYADWTYVTNRNITAYAGSSFDIIAANKTRVTGYLLQFQCNEYEKTPTTPDFFLRPCPPLDKSVTQGESATYELRFVPNEVLPYTNPMTLTSSGQPQDPSVSFSPPSPFSSSQPRQVNVTTTPSTAIGVGIGKFLITITASNGIVEHKVSVTLTVNPSTDFELSISPPSRSVSQGNQAIYTVTARSGGGFSSPVFLNYSNIPAAGSTANFSINPVTPTSTGATTTFRIYTSLSTELGTKVFRVCGRGGSPEISHCATAIVAVTASTAPSFSLSMMPDERTVLRDSSTTFTVTVTSVNDFNSPVTLKLTGNPSGTSGTFSPNPVTPPGSGTVQSTLNITTTSAPLYGTYTITVNGTSSGFPSSLAQATLIVSSLSEPDFALYVFPSTLSIVQNKSGTATIQIVSVNNFEESVTLTLQDIPTGVTHSFANPTVAPLPGGYVNTKLTLQTSSSTSLGNYTLTLKGSGSSKNHTASLVLFVTSGAPSFGRCIIATATYGSELSPEVQFLRGFRDNRVLSTSGGREFMKVFNAWYYSFSPQVASWIAGNPSAREPFKMLLMPLLGILHLSEISYSTVAFAPEIAVILAGIVASSLIGVVYLSPILAVTCRRMSYKSRRRLLDWATLASAVSISLLAIGLLTSTPLLVMLTSSLLVLSTVTIGSWSVPIAVSRILGRCRKTTV